MNRKLFFETFGSAASAVKAVNDHPEWEVLNIGVTFSAYVVYYYLRDWPEKKYRENVLDMQPLFVVWRPAQELVVDGESRGTKPANVLGVYSTREIAEQVCKDHPRYQLEIVELLLGAR